MSKPLVVGLTGSFGSGKSTVAGYFRRWGASVIDADRLGHEALRPGSATYRKMVKIFGPDVRTRSGAINRARLGAWVFSDPRKRKKLEAVIHPYVFRRIAAFIKKHKRGIVVVDIPLLFETGYDRRTDRTITVAVQKKKLIRRLMKKRRLDRHTIEARLRAQMPIEQKKKRSDFVIENNTSISTLKKTARRIWAELKNEVN